MNDKKIVVRSFILGLILGGALSFTGLHCYRRHRMDGGLWGRHGHFDSKKLLEKFTKELDLSAEQKSQVEKILETNLPKMKALRETVRPQFKAIGESLQSEIRAVLKPDQLPKFNKMAAEYEARRKEREEKRDGEK